MINKTKKRQRGITALPIIIGITFLVLSLGISVNYIGFNSVISSVSNVDSLKALNYAESGIREALRKISLDKNYTTTGSSADCREDFLDCFKLDLTDNATGCGQSNNGCARVNVTSASPPSSIVKTIISEGNVKSQVRRITVIATLGTDGNIIEASMNEVPVTVDALYWVGGSGNWDDPSHWSPVSGGQGGGSGIPKSTTNAKFDCASFSQNGQRVTINTNASMKDFDWTGVTSSCSFSNVGINFQDGNVSNIYGSLRFPTVTPQKMANITTNGTINFKSSTAGNIIDMGGSSPVTMKSAVYFDAQSNGVDWKLESDFTTLGDSNAVYYVFMIKKGTLDTNGKNLNIREFYVRETGAKSLKLTGNSIMTINGSRTEAWDIAGEDFTLEMASTATLKFTGSDVQFEGQFAGAPASYGTVIFEGLGEHKLKDANTFTNLRVNAGSFRDSQLILHADQTVTGQFSVTGSLPEGYKRIFVNSDVRGIQRKIITPSFSATRADFMDIAACTGAQTCNAPSFLGSSVGDAMNNTNITFDSPRTLHWCRNGGNWSDSGKWFMESSAGSCAGPASYPLPQDTAVFDVNSFNTSSQVVAIDMLLPARHITFLGADGLSPVTSSPTLSIGWGGVFEGVKLTGDLKLAPNMTWSSYTRPLFTPRNGTVSRIKTSGVVVDDGVDIDAPGGTVRFEDDFVTSPTALLGPINLIKGTLDLSTHNANITAYSLISSNNNTRAISMGFGTVTLRNWDTTNVTNMTFARGTSTIKIFPSTTGSTFYSSDIAGGFYKLKIGNQNGDVHIKAPFSLEEFEIEAPETSMSKTVTFEPGMSRIITTKVLNANGLGPATLVKLLSFTSGSRWHMDVTNGYLTNGVRTFLAVRDSDVTRSTQQPLACTGCNTEERNNVGWQVIGGPAGNQATRINEP